MATTGERSSGPSGGRIRRKIRRYGSHTSRRKSVIRLNQIEYGSCTHDVRTYTKISRMYTHRNTSMKVFTFVAASASKASVAIRREFGSSRLIPSARVAAGAEPARTEAALHGRSPRILFWSAPTSGALVGRTGAALEQAGAFLRRDLHVARGEQEDLVRHALHPAIERVREPAREVDQALRELLVGALEVEDHRDRVLELVGDLLRIVEAARHDEVHLHRGHGAHRRGRVVGRTAAVAARAQGGRRRRLLGVRVGPVVEVLLPAPRSEPAHVRPLAVGAPQLLLGEVAVLVPVVLLLGDAEVDERSVPNVCKSHGFGMLLPV